MPLVNAVHSYTFHPAVQEFLSNRQLSPSTLSRIQEILNYDMRYWLRMFGEAGLSDQDAHTLRAIVYAHMPREFITAQRAIA